MANKNIQLLDASGNYMFPKTNASLVYNTAGETLADVEPGAEVNVISSISVNGTALEVVDKTVNISISSQSEYLITKAATADAGYVSTYIFTKDGSQVGDKINIPKDLVVESGDVKVCEEADVPVAGYQVGDKYIDLVLANQDNSHVYILVSDLVDTYTAGNGITLTNNAFAIDTTVVATVAGMETALAAKANTADMNTALAAKQDTITGAATSIVSANLTASKALVSDANGKVAASAIDASKIDYLSGVTSDIQTQLDGKAASATTLAGYGILDALTYQELA